MKTVIIHRLLLVVSVLVALAAAVMIAHAGSSGSVEPQVVVQGAQMSIPF